MNSVIEAALERENAGLRQQLESANKRSDELKSTLDSIAYRCLGVGERGTYVPSTMADEIASKITRLQQQLEAERAKVAKLDQLKRDAEGVADHWRTRYQNLHAVALDRQYSPRGAK